MIRKTASLFALALSLALLAGCATTPGPLSFVYAPSVEARGGSGELFLKSARCDASGSGSDIRFVIGKRKNAEGEVTGEIVSRLSAEDMVLDALKRELTVAGYKIACGPALPPGIAKGVDLAEIRVELEEVAGVSKIEVTGKVQIALEIWKAGNKVRRIGYQSKITDFAVLERSHLPRMVIEQGLHEVMRQATPEIVAVLEAK